jgi:plasmid stability protein
MVRTQIQLTEDQHKQLKRRAARLGISFSEAVRRCIEERLSAEGTMPDRKTLIRDALAVCGRYDDPQGPSRVALDHDRHLAEAYRE